MRLGRKNKQKIKYALLVGTSPIYVLDENGNKIVDYVGDDGTVYYVVTGGKQTVYTDPTEIEVNISFSGGEIKYTEFGIDSTEYDASLVYLRNEFPIEETTLIWYDSEPSFIGEGENRTVDPNSADYKVLYIKPSLNYVKLLLGKLAK